MSFKRVHALGPSAIFLLHLVACSSPSKSEQAKTRDSGAENERVDLGEAGSPGDPPATAPAPTTPADCKNADDSFDVIQIKWKNELTKPPVFDSTETINGVEHYKVSARREKVQMLPSPLCPTPVLAYGGKLKQVNATDPAAGWYSPGPTFEMTQGTAAKVEWANEIADKHVLTLGSPPLGIPNAQNQVPYVTHVHGLEVPADSDGAPEAWFTMNPEVYGPLYQKQHPYEYPNSQPATALWYHDHTFGMTRYNVYAGLAGMYIIRNLAEFEPTDRAHEMPLVIQDRQFDPKDSTLIYTPSGNMKVVNGKVWPDMKVEPTRYRFRILNGGNSSFYNLAFPADAKTNVTVIGSDGGYLAAPVKDVKSLPLAPGERADVLIDFSNVPLGQSVILNDLNDQNDFPNIGEVVRFTVVASNGPLPTLRELPTPLNTIPDLQPDTPTPTPTSTSTPTALPPAARTLTLNTSDDGVSLLDGQAWDGALSETPQVGSTEDWDIVNLTSVDHPIHLHLVQFRIVSRRGLETSLYQAAWTASNGDNLPLKSPTTKVEIEERYLTKFAAKDPAPAEAGWKDTIVVPGDTVTRIRIRWAPQEPATTPRPGSNPFAFDPTEGRYVWHCHMLEHEDNEMMRPFKLR